MSESTKPDAPETPAEGATPNVPTTGAAAASDSTANAANPSSTGAIPPAPTQSTKPEPGETTETTESVEEEFVLTPEIMRSENLRTDLILAGGVALVAFFLGAFLETNPDIWISFRSGQLISETFPRVPMEDSLSYTSTGARWINPSWLFDWMNYQLYQNVGEIVLILLKSLFGVACAGLLLLTRHRGPTLWGMNLCVLLALLAAGPRFILGPEIVTLLLLAALLACWFQAKYFNRFWMIYLALPITILWANIDVSYVFAPFILLSLALGEIVQQLLPRSLDFEAARLGWSRSVQLLGIGLVCLFVGFLTPYGFDMVTYPYHFFLDVVPNVRPQEKLSPFREWGGLIKWEVWLQTPVGEAVPGELPNPFSLLQEFVEGFFNGQLPWYHYAWSILAIGSIGSFTLNWEKFSVSRFLLLGLALFLPFLAVRFFAPSAFLLALILAHNGQEFFINTFGRDTRITPGWVAWSQFGRAITVILMFIILVATFTSRIVPGRIFGLGIRNDTFMVETAEWLNKMKFQGRALAFTDQVASYLSFACPQLQQFIDSRWQIYPNNIYQDYSLVRNALISPNREKSNPIWQKIFDQYGITHIVVDPDYISIIDMQVLLDSSQLMLLYGNGQGTVLGYRGQHVDTATFQSREIDTNAVVFKPAQEGRFEPEVPGRFLLEPTLIDTIWTNRQVPAKELFTGRIYGLPLLLQQRANRLGPPWALNNLKQPGATYLAIQYYRQALAENPDNPQTYQELGYAYLSLYFLEMEKFLIADREMRQEQQRQELTRRQLLATGSTKPGEILPEQLPQLQTRSIDQVPSYEAWPLRHMQIMYNLSYAVKAGIKDEAPILQSLSYLCRVNNCIDTSRDYLQRSIAAFDKINSSQILDEQRQRVRAEIKELLTEQLGRLEKFVESQTNRFDEQMLAFEKAATQAQQPVSDVLRLQQEAVLAINLGLTELALTKFEQLKQVATYSAGNNPGTADHIRTLIRLGLLEDALTELNIVSRPGTETPGFKTGESEAISALIELCIGNYESATATLTRAVNGCRQQRVSLALNSFGQRTQRGLFATAIEGIPKYQELVGLEANYRALAGMINLERGNVPQAQLEFTQALTLEPRYLQRPILALYGELMEVELPAPAGLIDNYHLIAKVFSDRSSNSVFDTLSNTNLNPTPKPASPKEDLPLESDK